MIVTPSRAAFSRIASRRAPGKTALDALAREIADCGVADTSRRYNLTWMDRLNLENLTLVSRAIAAAADYRRDSRGAHFREDFPQASDLAGSRYTSVRLAGDQPVVSTQPVVFTRVQPGQTLLGPTPAAGARSTAL